MRSSEFPQLMSGLLIFAACLVVAAPAAGLEPPSAEQSRQIHRELGGKAGKLPVVLFVTSWCPRCISLEQSLKAAGVSYIRADIEEDEKAKKFFKKLSGKERSGVPLTLVGTELYSGDQSEKIIAVVKNQAGR